MGSVVIYYRIIYQNKKYQDKFCERIFKPLELTHIHERRKNESPRVGVDKIKDTLSGKLLTYTRRFRHFFLVLKDLQIVKQFSMIP